MKQKWYLLAAAAIGLAVSACTEKLDVNNMDPHIQANLALALPVGEISTSVGDFLGGSSIYYREDGVLYWRDTLKIDRQYHMVDLKQYYSSVTKEMRIQDIAAYQEKDAIEGDGITHVLSFPLTLTLNMNDVFDEERIDSAYIAAASFTSRITHNFALEPEYIKRINLRLPKNIHRAAGNVISLPVKDFAYGNDVTIVVDDFILDLMKDHNATPSNTNVINTVTFTVDFYVRVPAGHDVPINSTSSFTYFFGIDFIDFVALWGTFQPGNQMIDDTSVKIDSVWEAWHQIRDLHLPLADPSVELHVTSEIGAPLTLHIDRLSVKEEATGEERYATFNGATSISKALPNFVDINAEFGTTATNIITFNKDAANGHIDDMFAIRPDVVFYKYQVYINDDYYYKTNYPQHRLTNNTQLHIDAVVTIPFAFNKGLEVSYTDTLKDLNISEVSLDSLLKDVPVVEHVTTKELGLVLTAENYLPFNAKFAFAFFDENGVEIDLQQALDGKEIVVNGPTSYDPQGRITKPGVTHKTIKVSQDNLDKLTKIKQIRYTASLYDVDEKSLSNAAAVYPVHILNTSSINLKIAIAADVEAYLNVELNKKK